MELMEGSEAIAGRCSSPPGCRFFAGYPMTPFTEVLEHMAKRLPPVGGVCMNAESELEAVGMAWGAAATGAIAATGSTGQGLSLMQESLSEITLARLPLVVLNMARAQGDYWQATRGGGHGDYRHLVLAPADVTEAVAAGAVTPSTWRSAGAIPCCCSATTSWPTPTSRSSCPPIRELGRRARLGARRPSGGSGQAKLISSLGSHEAARGRRLRPVRALCRRALPPPKRCWPASRRGSRPAGATTPSWSWSPSARRRGSSVTRSRQLREPRRARRLRPAHHAGALSQRGACRGRAGLPRRRRLREQPGSDGGRRPAGGARQRARDLHRRALDGQLRLRHRARSRRRAC